MAQYHLEINALSESLPSRPGVYLFKDEKERILYVGKAKDIRKRVLSYLIRQNELSERIQMMLKETKGVDIVLTNNENEAFILERNLIKKWMPKFNIVLRDDKQYPLLRINMQDPFPNISIVRKVKRDGAKYFGPYTSSNAMRETLRVLHKAFPLRKCKGALKLKARPCINYQMKRCAGPCAGLISEEAYKQILSQALLFLEGRGRSLVEKLRKEMLELAEAMEFEKAALIRDRIKAINRTLEPQAVVFHDMQDRDMIGIAEGANYMHVVVLRLREGLMQDTISYKLSGVPEIHEALSSFIKQFYPSIPDLIPEIITLPVEMEESEEIAAWLGELSQRRVQIKAGKTPSEKRLLKMAEDNAKRLCQEEAKRSEDILSQLKDALNLRRYPRRIECVDISNLSGDHPVGEIVCYLDAKPYKKGYRSFKIKGVTGIDDYGMMKEVIKRRMKYPDIPEVLLIDGGKGHLNAVHRIMTEEISLEDPPELIAIAKAKAESGQKEDFDKIYMLNRKDPVKLPTSLLHFLMAIRDEAHRRAISHYSKRKRKSLQMSYLDSIKGIGPKRKKMLLMQFGSIDNILNASVEELIKLPGITPDLARRIIHATKMGTGNEDLK